MALEISFCCRLAVSWCIKSKARRQNSSYTPDLHSGKVMSTTSIWAVPYTSCAVKKSRSKISLPTHKLVVDIFSEFALQFQQCLLDLDVSAKNSMFQNPFNCATGENFHLQMEAINLQHNDTLKGKYEEKNLTELHKCLPSNEYAQLKPYTHRLISAFGSSYEKKFSKIKYIKSH